MKEKIITIFITVLTLLSFFSCEKSIKHKKTLKIVIIGDGISNSCEHRPYNINAAQGKAILKGAEIYYKNNPFLKNHNIELQKIGDCGDAGIAKQKALKIARDPSVIAVIGHGTSGTSYAAQDIYRTANIPFFLPIATSYKVCRNENGDFYRNAFRLPLNDNNGQAPALYSFIKSLNKTKICLIKDVSDDAPTYSEPLFNSIDKFISNDNTLTVYKSSYNRNELSIIDNLISSKIKGNDILIFCGYGTNANDLLKKIKEKEYLKNLIIVLTDGCLIQDLYSVGLNIYLTFPIPIFVDINNKECQSDSIKSVSKNKDISFEMNGYDALKIIDQTIKELINNNITVNRKNIINFIHTKNLYKGKCNTYSLINGENILGHYYVYKFIKDSIKMEKEYSYDQLQEIITNFKN